MRILALAMAAAAVLACKGPPIGSKIPAPNKKLMAGAAAAAATAATLANPDAAGRKPEPNQEDQRYLRESPLPTETVPASALDRLDRGEGAGQASAPCQADHSDETKSRKPRLTLLPVPNQETGAAPGNTSGPTPRCGRSPATQPTQKIPGNATPYPAPPQPASDR